EPSIETNDLRDMIVMSYLQHQVARRNGARLRSDVCREVEDDQVLQVSKGFYSVGERSQDREQPTATASL
ncbi:MAG: hypothetical protein ABI142_08755, partial [Bryocella sp.]